MPLPTGYTVAIAQTVLALLLAPGLVGLIRWLKARLQNRRGAPVWQPYLELRKLFAKEVVVSEHASWLFRAAPFVVFASAVAVTFLVPILAVPLPFDTVGDLIVVVYLLLLGTFFLALAGLDPGSAFGGMGASREMTVAALAEPTIALAIFALALNAGSTNLGQIVARALADPAVALSPGHLLAFGALFVVALAETGRLPVDHPATHLELTMIHEAMVLEYSGRYLALIEWAAPPAMIAHCTRDWQLYVVAALLLALKGVAIPLLLQRMDRRFGAERELEPYVNTGTSLLIGGLLVVLAYVIARPLVALSQLPTRAGMPLALGLIFVSLFVIISRKKALTQVIGFLALENGIALLALLGTYGIPFIVEMCVFLDALMGFLVMQIVICLLQ